MALSIGITPKLGGVLWSDIIDKPFGPNYITPEQYGAKGDGITDDTEAFQLALNNASCKVMYLQGDYKITSKLTVFDYTTILSDSKRQVNIYTTGNAVFDSLNYCYIKGIYFTNQNNENANFIEGKTYHSVLLDNTAKAYTNIFNGGVVNLSRIERNVFNSIKNKFCSSSVDSSFSRNYINASVLSFDNSICFGSINNTVINGNYIDYWGKVFFTTSSNHVSTISNNIIDNSYIVFYHRVHSLAIVGNSFSNIHYEPDNFSVTLSEDKQGTDWSIFRFQTTDIAGIDSQFHDVTFSGNTLSDEVDYLILVDNNTGIHACVNSVQIIGNAIHPYTKTVFRAIASSTDKNFKNMYIQTLEDVNYTQLPNAQLTSTNGASNPVVSYQGHTVRYNNKLVTNINGEWYYNDGTRVSDNIIYAKLTDIPVVPKNISAFTNDANYILRNEFIDNIAQLNQITPEFAESEEWLDANGDRDKVYVLPDGYIYGYKTNIEVEEAPPQIVTTPAKAAIVVGKRYSQSGGNFVTQSNVASVIIPIVAEELYQSTDTINNTVSFVLNGMTMNSTYQNIYYGETNTTFEQSANKSTTDYIHMQLYNIKKGKWFMCIFVSSTGATGEFDNVSVTFNGKTIACEVCPDSSYAAHESVTTGDSTETIITEGFVNTGHTFVPADYEDRIIALERKIVELEALCK